MGSGSARSTSFMSLINLGVGIILTSSTALLKTIAIIITKKYFSKLKMRYTKWGDWSNVSTLLNEETLKTSMVAEKSDEKEAEELKKGF